MGKPQGNVYYYNDTEWKDKLTKINNDNITYDESGNPLSYRDGMSFIWQNGRQLASLQTEDNSVTYKYDSNGMRTQKTDNNGTTYYYYDSNKNLIGLTKGNDTLLFYYDSDANVTSFKYNGTMYYYIKNLQGDIVKIIDQAGTEVAGYVYDAWGTIHSQTGDPNIRRLNPFRYRGYVYDEETSLYYLQSRYYDPFSGRFLNADDTAFIGATGTVLSCNLFTYCENNSIKYTDKTGTFLISAFATYIIAGLAFTVVCVALLNKSVQRAIKKVCEAIGNGIKNLCQSFVDIIDKAVSKAKTRTKLNKYEVHHIVAQKDRRAADSRKLLTKANIGINSSNNKVSIKYRLHKFIHTDSYHKNVYRLLSKAKGNR